MKRIYFFATKNDLLLMFQEIEKKENLKYLLENPYKFPQYGDVHSVFYKGKDLPNLGIADGRDIFKCAAYVVMKPEVEFLPITKHLGEKMADGGYFMTYFPVNKLYEGIRFNGGGVWNGVHMSGLIDTMFDQPEPQRLMRRFLAAIKKTFPERRSGYWMGPEAFENFKNGGKFAQYADMPESNYVKYTPT